VKGINKGVGRSEVRLAPFKELWCERGLEKLSCRIDSFSCSSDSQEHFDELDSQAFVERVVQIIVRESSRSASESLPCAALTIASSLPVQ
jgi:hypothetical protein